MENGKKLIILVDDIPVNLQIGKDVLSEKYIVATAPSAKKMFALLQNNTPAMILLDIEMPEMDGFEAIQLLKSQPETRNIPVIFLSSHIEPNYKRTALSLGAVDYIGKPFEPSVLLECIKARI